MWQFAIVNQRIKSALFPHFCVRLHECTNFEWRRTFPALFALLKVRSYCAENAAVTKNRTNVHPKCTYRFTSFNKFRHHFLNC